MAEQQPSASLSPEAAPSAASTKTTTAPAAVPLATDEDAAERAEHMGSYAPPLASLPTLKDIRRDPNLLEARRTRSRTLSMSQDPGQARLGRTLSRVLEPCVPLFLIPAIHLLYIGIHAQRTSLMSEQEVGGGSEPLPTLLSRNLCPSFPALSLFSERPRFLPSCPRMC